MLAHAGQVMQNEPTERCPVTLNRRHKAGAFLVLVAAGLSLSFEASAKQTAGIVLLGVAATWLFGSVSLRVLGFVSCSLGCISGLCVAILPILSERDSYLAASAEYDLALAEIRAAVARAPVWEIKGLPEGTVVRPQNKTVVPSLQDKWQVVKEEVVRPLNKSVVPPPPPGFTEDVSPSTQIPRPPKGFFPEPPKREVQIPAVGQKWLRPMDAPADYVVVSIPFPGDASDTAIMSEFQTKYLLPRPTFSIAAAIRPHRAPFLGGVVLVAVGLLGFAAMLKWGRKAKPVAIASPAA